MFSFPPAHPRENARNVAFVGALCGPSAIPSIPGIRGIRASRIPVPRDQFIQKKNTMNRDPSIQSAQCKFTTSTKVTGIPRIPGIPVPITGDQIIQTKSNQQRVINVTRGPVSRTGSRLEIIDRNSMRLSLNGFNLLNESSAGSRAFDWSNGPVRPVPSTPISSSPPLDVTEFFIFRFFFTESPTGWHSIGSRRSLVGSACGFIEYYRVLLGFIWLGRCCFWSSSDLI